MARIKTRKNRKAQEEIVGFVLIVVIVAVVFLIVFGIFVRKGNKSGTEKDSSDVLQYIQSLMEYTTNCKIMSESEVLNFGGLVKACYESENCENLGEVACAVLKRTAEEAIETSWKVGQESFYKGYIFNSSYSSASNSRGIAYVAKGNCSSNKIGSDSIFPASFGTITTSLKICT